jgi:pimeloyl-ACP methyl ester carboxylesterase
VPGAKAYARDLKSVELHILEGAGHFALESNSPDIADFIRNFLGKQVLNAR